MRIDPNELRARHVYRLMTSLIVPRPIAWTGTRSVAGVDNLAPFSYFMGVSSAPPAVAISVARRDRGGTLKDTARNILDTRQFTVSIVSAADAQAMVDTSAPWAPDVSEFTAVGVDLQRGELVDAGFPRRARAALECRLVHAHDMGSTHLLVGEVVMVHLSDAVAVTGPDGGPVADILALDPLARLGGADYTKLGPIRSLSATKVDS